MKIVQNVYANYTYESFILRIVLKIYKKLFEIIKTFQTYVFLIRGDLFCLNKLLHYLISHTAYYLVVELHFGDVYVYYGIKELNLD